MMKIKYKKDFNIHPETSIGQKHLIKIAKHIAKRKKGEIEICNRIQNFQIDSNTPKGKQAFLDILDEKGNLVARSIATLGRSESGKAVMLMEEVYPTVLESDIKNALINFAIRRGQLCGIDVVAKEGKEREKYPETFIAEGNNKTPWEYVDALKGVKSNKRFEIKNLYYLYKIPEKIQDY